MQMGTGGLATASRYADNGSCRYVFILPDSYLVQMTIQTFQGTMIQNDIITVTSISQMYFLHHARHHGIYPRMIALEVNTVMEPAASGDWILAIAVC